MNKIGHFFRWIFLNKEDNTWEDYCKHNGLVKEEPKVEAKEEIKTIILEKTTDKKETEKLVEEEIAEEVKESYNRMFPYFSNAEKIERCKQIICNYTYGCIESKTAVADLLGNNRNEWYIVADGLDGRSKLITESLEYLTKKKWEYLGEVESCIYGWKVDYSKMLDKDYETINSYFN